MKTAIKILCWLSVLLFIFLNFQKWWSEKEVSFLGFISLILIAGIFFRITMVALEYFKIISHDSFINARTLFASFMVTLAAGEIGMRLFTENYRSYGERNGSHYYGSPYHIWLHRCDSCPGHDLFINEPNSTDPFIKTEFHYPHQYNSLGLRDREFSTKKSPKEYRILGIGDSFTEGVGAPADSSWLKQLAYRLNTDTGGAHYSTMNAGVHGSDLFFSYDLLTNCLLKYHPDLVILDLNSTDINDVIWRGNYNRFDAKGNFVGKKGPWWEYIFGSSYVARRIILDVLHYNWGLLTAGQEKLEEDEALAKISQKITDFDTLAQQQHFKFLLVLQPLKEELSTTDAYAQLKVDTAVKSINLYPYFKDKIITHAEPLERYYWPIDGHFKSTGYGAMAEEIYEGYFKKEGYFLLNSSSSASER